MTNDKIAHDSYRNFYYFYKNKIKVHFKDFDERWYNGLILDLDKEKLTLVLRERVKGEMPILLEKVNPDSIRKMKEEFQ